MYKSIVKSWTLIVILNLFFSCSSDSIDYQKSKNVETYVINKTINNSIDYFEDTSKTRTTIMGFSQSNSEIDNLVKYDVKSYRIVYNTTDNSGNPTQASGTLLVPQKNNLNDTFSVLSYQHGTNMGDADVLTSSFNDEVFLAASTGFITMVPDYLGYNSSSQIQHPYFINVCSNKTVRDMITSSLSVLDDLEINHDGQLFLNGFSEGANVTISFLKSVETNPISGLQIKATSASSGAYALGDQFSIFMQNYFQNNGQAPATNPILCYMIYGYEKNIAKTNNNSIYFANPYFNLVPHCFSGNYGNVAAATFFNSYKGLYPQIFSTSFVISLANGTNLGFKKYLDDNSLIINWAPTSKLKLYHSNNDSKVTYQNTIKLYNKMSENAVNSNNITKDTGLTEGHSSEISFQRAILWLNSNR